MSDTNFSIENITNIITSYCNYIPYQGKFVEENCHPRLAVINDNKIGFSAKRGFSCLSAKLDTPINMNVNGIYHWQIKFSSNRNTDPWDIIGVVSNECNNIGVFALNKLQDFYAISACAGFIWMGTKNSSNMNERRKTKSITVDDIVTVELDCKLSEITFKIKGLDIDI